jgi:hypothetical protein
MLGLDRFLELGPTRGLGRRIVGVLGATLLLASPGLVHAGLLPFRIEAAGEWANLRFSPLAEYSRFATGLNGDRDEQREIRFDDTDVRGFRVGISPHPDFEFGWSRLLGVTNYEFSVDGVPSIHGDDSAGPAVLLGRVDLRFDLISVRLRPSRFKLGPIRPVLGLGYGWVLQSQQNAFRPPNSLPVDYSDSDKAVEATLGLRGEWSRFHGGAQLRSVHWNWNTEDPKIPEHTTHAWSFGLWFGIQL